MKLLLLPVSLLMAIGTQAGQPTVPNVRHQTWVYLESFLSSFDDTSFGADVSLGDRDRIQLALSLDLDIDVDSDLEAIGRYDPPDARWGGSVFGWRLRNSLLTVRELTDDFSARKTLWHEFLHHMIFIEGGEACGPEEAYLELLEERVDWLSLLVPFDRYVRSIDAIDRNTCQQVQRRWQLRVDRWEGEPGTDLGGPYGWQDPGGTTCGDADRIYRITSTFIERWDRALGIDIDLATIATRYEQTIETRPSSLDRPCALVIPPTSIDEPANH